jgi:hypothetical protein
MSQPRLGALLALATVLSTSAAFAQPLGTFRWQLQPYCNVFTLQVTQQGGIYILDGTDDRCGAGNQAGSAVGIAYLTPLGLVGFGITTVLPGGVPVHTEATISIATLSGTWRDSAGNNGTFTFTTGAPGPGAPRAVSTTGLAPASITNVFLASNAVNSTNVADNTITTADILDEPRAAFANQDTEVTLTPSFVPFVLDTISITAPTAGRVILSAGGYFRFNNTATIDVARCSITTGTTIDFSALTLTGESVANGINFTPLATTRGVAVAAGTHTFNLVCDRFSGEAIVGDPQLTGIFVANAQ